MPAVRPLLFLAAATVFGAGCTATRPVLYPNDHLTRVGDAQAQRDIDECKRLAADYVSGHRHEAAKQTAAETGTGAAVGAAVGAAGGAVYGSAGQGAAAGAAGGAAAGLLHGILRRREPSPVYRNFVITCLGERGYRVIGWR
jgi:hypothetical protein